jgi:hypothetical protein
MEYCFNANSLVASAAKLENGVNGCHHQQQHREEDKREKCHWCGRIFGFHFFLSQEEGYILNGINVIYFI